MRRRRVAVPGDLEKGLTPRGRTCTAYLKGFSPSSPLLPAPGTPSGSMKGYSHADVEVNLESLQAGLGGLEGGARDLSFATRGIAGILADATERAFADEADPTTGVFPAHAGVVPRRRKRAASRASSSSLNAPATSATWAASRPWTPHSAWGSPSGPWDRRHPDLVPVDRLPDSGYCSSGGVP